jgi:hypothetical protein
MFSCTEAWSLAVISLLVHELLDARSRDTNKPFSSLVWLTGK